MNQSETAFIYIPGGPGLNSYAEREMLAPKLKQFEQQFIFWDEPRNFKTANYYQEILTNLSSKIQEQDREVVLIAHSFGCHLVMDLLSSIENKVKGIVFLTPAINMQDADFRIIDHSLSILKNTNQEVAKELELLIPRLNKSFDSTKGEAMLLAFQSGYFIENFVEAKNFTEFFSYLQGEFEFRVNDFVKIRESADQYLKNENFQSSIPLLSIFGEKDPIFSYKTEKGMIESYFKQSKNLTIESMSHYPHVEDTNNFLNLLENFLQEI